VSRVAVAAAWVRRTWQPLAVVAGTVVALIGATGVAWALTAWLAPPLGPWPAATVGGTLTAAAALRWGRLTLVD
jgi:hypothetical protein